MKQPVTESYTDIHSHILPGVDDGARNMQEAISMLKIAAEERIKIVFATPHFQGGRKNASADILRMKMDELQNVAKDIAPDLKLFLGNEMYYSESAFEALLRGDCLTLAGSRYVLVEFHPQEHYRQMRQSLFRIISEGYSPILAHAERYDGLKRNITDWEALVRMGVYIQVNADTVVKGHSLLGSSKLKKLLRARLIHFIATDCHNTGPRGPRLNGCFELVAKKYGQAYAHRLFKVNCEKILKDEMI